MNPTYRFILEMITKGNPKKRLVIVDYGCGNGKLLEYLPKGKIKNYFGFDINKDALKEARKKYTGRNIHFRLAERKTIVIPLKNSSVDVIVNIGVLQYLSDKLIEGLLKESRRVLKGNGIIVGSCFSDHVIYKVINIYKIFLPHRAISYSKINSLSKKHSFKMERIFERGLIISPFFSNVVFLFFDALDKILLRTKGKLGFLGDLIRIILMPLIWAEFLLPVNYGYTLFFCVKNNKKSYE